MNSLASLRARVNTENEFTISSSIAKESHIICGCVADFVVCSESDEKREKILLF
jgi:hypothetical protein